MTKIFFTVIAFFLILLSGCYIYNTGGTGSNYASTYKKDAIAIHPEFTVFHKSADVSELYFTVNSKELLYTRQYGENEFTAEVRISYRLLISYESQQVVDSSYIKFIDENGSPTKKVAGKFTFNASYGNTYLLEIILSDLKRGQSVKTYINVDKRNGFSRQNFLIKEESNKTPFFKNYFNETDKVVINYKQSVPVFYVRYYKRNFPVSAPPFSISENKPFDYRADSVFSVPLKSETSSTFTFLKEGFYHFQADTTQNEGLTLYVFGKGFPEIYDVQDLFSPLLYITTNEEYNDINIDKNKKQAIDNFWLNIAGSKERAKEIIRKFYNRVQDANVFFSSYIEGWQTDRGMIYLIYGAPNSIHKTSYSESWVYGEENNAMSLTFNFIKVINPFTDNDYALERSPLYKTSWYRAVDTWRQGKVY